MCNIHKLVSVLHNKIQISLLLLIRTPHFLNIYSFTTVFFDAYNIEIIYRIMIKFQSRIKPNIILRCV